MTKQLNELAERHQAMGEPSVVVGPGGAAVPGTAADDEALRVSVLEDVVPCPFCDEPMSEDEIVCRHCDHYVNQVSAHGETDDMAPVPELYSEDRNYRFDALWRLVFAGDEESLEAVIARPSRPGRAPTGCWRCTRSPRWPTRVRSRSSTS